MLDLFTDPSICLAPPGADSRPVHAVRPAGLAAALDALDPRQAAFARAAGFAAGRGEVLLLPGDSGVDRALLGLGASAGPHPFGALPAALPAGTDWHIEPGDFTTEDTVLGFCLGAYRFDGLKNRRGHGARLAGAEHAPGALAAARATWLARDLINTPANLLGPEELAAATLTLGGRHGAEPMRVEGASLPAAYPTVAAVGAGSDRGPVVAGFSWSGPGDPAEQPLVALCGKGVCFDSGGYDLKPSSAMLRMKKDMGGAALMLALASMIMDAALPVRLVVRIGCVENMVSGGAMRPLDVLRTRRGLTVEVGNTDAEGRLVLCDLLAETSDLGPDLVVDAATLTGAARVALGPDLPAMFCNDDDLATAVAAAGAQRNDPVWRLPLWPGYETWLDSKVADMNNVASKPVAGAVVAALFLQRFLAPGTRWVHLDTYAWNDQTRPGQPEGGEALGLHALFETIVGLKRFNKSDSTR